MKLHEIIQYMSEGNTAIPTEYMVPYKKSLLIYYRDLFPSEPVIMVTSVFNVGSFGIIVPSYEMTEAFDAYYNSQNDEDKEQEFETVCFNSIFLKDL